MKKILLIYFFAFCGCLGFCPDSQAKILEKNVWAGMYCNWSLSDDGVMVIKGTGKMELQELSLITHLTLPTILLV